MGNIETVQQIYAAFGSGDIPARYSSAQYLLEYLRSYYGPTLKAFESLDEAGWEALARDYIEHFKRWNISGDATLVDVAEYLEAVAVRR